MTSALSVQQYKTNNKKTYQKRKRRFNKMSTATIIYDNLLRQCDTNYLTNFHRDSFSKRIQSLFMRSLSDENRASIMDHVAEDETLSRSNSSLANAGITKTSELKSYVDLFYLTKYVPCYRKRQQDA